MPKRRGAGAQGRKGRKVGTHRVNVRFAIRIPLGGMILGFKPCDTSANSATLRLCVEH